MSAKSRCHTCEHPRGARTTNPLTKGGHKCVASCARRHAQTEPGQPRKASCGCECHQ
jgi:hypothetical protein